MGFAGLKIWGSEFIVTDYYQGLGFRVWVEGKGKGEGEDKG